VEDTGAPPKKKKAVEDPPMVIKSPRSLLAAPDAPGEERKEVAQLISKSDTNGFIMFKGAGMRTKDVPPGEYVLVCSDASPEAITSVAGTAENLLIPLNIILRP